MTILTNIIRTLRGFRNSSPEMAIILVYHRIIGLSCDPQLLAVSPDNFAEHLEVLGRDYHVVSLTELLENIKRGTLHPRSVAITFDDGYADNLDNGQSLLAQYGFPGTVFVVSGQVDAEHEFWWDELEKVFLQPGALPGELRLSVNGKFYEKRLDHTREYDAERYEQYRGWNVLIPESPTERQEIYRDTCQLLRPLDHVTRDAALEDIAQWAGVTRQARSTHRSLSADGLRQIASSGLIDIGAHTMTHPALSSLPSRDQHKEITLSKKLLEDILGQTINAFSYPYGTVSDYSSETVRLLRQAGFNYACSNFPGPVSKKSDRFQLPRHLVRNWDGKQFSMRLREWTGG